MRTDAQNHRPLAGDSDEASAIRVLARAHQSLIWTRQRQVNGLRSALRDYFPGALLAFGTDLASSDALAILEIAPTPAAGRALSRAKIASALRRAGRQRNPERWAAEIQQALRAEQPQTADVVADAFGAAAAREWRCWCRSTSRSPRSSAAWPSILIVTRTPRSCAVGPDSAQSSAPGRLASSGMTRAALPMLGRKAYAGTAPITEASGRSLVVLARVARNRRLADACER